MRSLNFSLVLFVVCSLDFAVYAQWAIEDSGCRTPDNGIGDCILVYNCQPLTDLLSRLKKPISSALQKKILAYTCGTSRQGVKVCCPPGPISFNLLPEKCGYLDINDKIINGETAALNEFPWMALLKYKTRKGTQFACGGTIINKNYILTAAHCITGLGSSRQLLSVRVGEHSINNETDCETIKHIQKCNPPVQNVAIEEIIPHPQYNTPLFQNDIGLLRVSTMNFNFENVQPICLPVGPERSKTFSSVFVTGWGITNYTTNEHADELQKVKLSITDRNTCFNRYNSINVTLTERQICAEGKNKQDSCNGDSGGPMMVPTVKSDGQAAYIQYGVVSFGPKFCGETGSLPGVYTVVPHYMDWILDTMRP